MDTPLEFRRSRQGWLDRLLSPLAPVRPGEGGGALLLASNIFLVLFSYYILKTVRESLILSEAGAVVKSYSGALQAVLLLLIVPLYGAFGSRVNRLRLINWVTLFFISHLLIFAALGARGIHVGIAFFLWVGIFNVLVIAQFWAFANDIYSEEQGKRLFAIVGIGSSLGAWLGAVAAGDFFAALGPYRLMLAAAVLLSLSLLITYIVHRRESTGEEKGRVAAEPLGKQGGFRLVLKERYLFLIAALIVVLNVVNTIGEFLLGKLVVNAADLSVGAGANAEALKKAFIGQFYGNFFGWVNLLGFLFQLFLVSRIFKYIGVRGALFILPCIALGGYGLLLTLPDRKSTRLNSSHRT